MATMLMSHHLQHVVPPLHDVPPLHVVAMH